MTFEWDEKKNKANIKKHGISFNQAVYAFLDTKRIEEYDYANSSIDEDRYTVIADIGNFLITFVVCTYRKEAIRIISAREAEPNEKELYYDNYNLR